MQSPSLLTGSPAPPVVARTAGVDPSKPLVTTCGSGVTAAVVLFAAALLGREDVSLYDGSWSEWGLLPDTEKATGAACMTMTANA